MSYEDVDEIIELKEIGVYQESQCERQAGPGRGAERAGVQGLLAGQRQDPADQEQTRGAADPVGQGRGYLQCP